MAADSQRFLFIMPSILNLTLMPVYVIYVLTYLAFLLGP